MTLMVAGMLSESFGKGANDAANQRVLWQLRQQQENAKKSNPAQQREAEAESAADFVVSIINVEQAELLQSEIDIFQGASIEAIMAYDVEIGRVEAEIAQMLSDAHVLEDGRRVFKTEDGLRVFDEHGNELDDTIISAAEIGDEHPKWEDMKSLLDQREDLLQNRSEVLAFQERLDEAQERLDSGEMTQAEYNKLRTELYDTAPQAVRDLATRRGLEFEATTKPNIPAPPVTSEIEINLDDELSNLPKPPMPAPGMGT